MKLTYVWTYNASLRSRLTANRRHSIGPTVVDFPWNQPLLRTFTLSDKVLQKINAVMRCFCQWDPRNHVLLSNRIVRGIVRVSATGHSNAARARETRKFLAGRTARGPYTFHSIHGSALHGHPLVFDTFRDVAKTISFANFVLMMWAVSELHMVKLEGLP